MTSLPLLVPVAVEALVVNEADRRATMWSVVPRQHVGAEAMLSADPPPFARGASSVRTGVTLHWLLPDALTRGRPSGSGDVRQLRFPFIPDRWLVVRLATGPGEPQTRQWLVESDFLGGKGDGTNATPTADGVRYLGRAHRLDPDQQLGLDVRAPSLTAIGRESAGPDGRREHSDGDPSWAASAVEVDNVLSFHDDLDGLSADGPLVLSYSVVGWYSSPTTSDPMVDQSRLGQQLTSTAERGARPLTVEEWNAVMDALDWTVGSEADLMVAQAAAISSASGEVAGDAASVAADVVPDRTICHGSVFGVQWTGMGGVAQPFTGSADSAFAGSAIRSRAGWRNPAHGRPGTSGEFPDVAAGMASSDAIAARATRRDGEATPLRSPYPQVAIGSSLSDAMSAVIEYLLGYEDGGPEPSDVSSLFQALEHGRLEDFEVPGGIAALRRQLHQDGFVSSPGGIWWEIAFGAEDDSSGLPAVEVVLEDIRAEDSSLLEDLDLLNTRAAESERVDRRLRAGRRELYALWWKRQILAGAPAGVLPAEPTAAQIDRLLESPVPPEENVRSQVDADRIRRAAISDEITAIQARIRAALNESAAVARVLDGLAAERASTGAQRPRLELVARRRPRFYAPADPVVVISGARASGKHGGDGRYRPDGRLLARFGRRLEGGRGQTLRPIDGRPRPVDVPSLLATPLAGDDLDAVRRAAVDLIEEFVLLDATDPPGGDIWRPPTLEEATEEDLLRAAGLDGVRPSPVAVEKWAQPWRPLHLCWRGSWYPTASPKHLTAHWTLDAGEDHEWNGLNDFDHERSLTVQGRCLLSPSATRPLRDAVDDVYALIRDRPAPVGESSDAASKRLTAIDALRTDLDAFQQRLESADLLVQALTGFHDQLVQRERGRRRTPDDPALVTSLGDVERIAPQPFVDGSAGTSFTPLRNGHLQLRRLWVVDGFGQVFDLVSEQGQTTASFAPLRGRGVTTVGLAQRSDTQMVQLAPRLVQPSRLRMQFESGPGGGPLRGWLLPNRLDRSIMVYRHDGTSLGSLMRWHGSGEASVVWNRGAAESAVTAPGEIVDEKLSAVAATIDGFDTDAFDAFMQAVDRTLWTTDPLGTSEGTLAALVGRPMAVVAARCWIELDGPTLLDQEWSRTMGQPADRDGDVIGLELPMRLGVPESRADGTLGHFSGGEFHSVLPMLAKNAPGSVTESGPDSWPKVPVAAYGAMPANALDITILFDPRGSVHAGVGLLPTKSFRVDGPQVDAALAAMDASFRVGPLLTAGTVRMPLPSDIRGGWSWLEASGVGFTPMSSPVGALTEVAPLAEWPTRIREGWLELSDIAGWSEEDGT